VLDPARRRHRRQRHHLAPALPACRHPRRRRASPGREHQRPDRLLRPRPGRAGGCARREPRVLLEHTVPPRRSQHDRSPPPCLRGAVLGRADPHRRSVTTAAPRRAAPPRGAASHLIPRRAQRSLINDAPAEELRHIGSLAAISGSLNDTQGATLHCARHSGASNGSPT
jgi:hypothetical protein